MSSPVHCWWSLWRFCTYLQPINKVTRKHHTRLPRQTVRMIKISYKHVDLYNPTFLLRWRSELLILCTHGHMIYIWIIFAMFPSRRLRSTQNPINSPRLRFKILEYGSKEHKSGLRILNSKTRNVHCMFWVFKLLIYVLIAAEQVNITYTNMY